MKEKILVVLVGLIGLSSFLYLTVMLATHVNYRAARHSVGDVRRAIATCNMQKTHPEALWRRAREINQLLEDLKKSNQIWYLDPLIPDKWMSVERIYLEEEKE